jgi:hypothetical protein
MRSLLPLPFAAALLALPLLAQHPAPPPGTADQYPAFERHTADHLAIAVDPYDTPQKASTFRVDYTSANIIPIRIIVTNEGDTPISLNDARIDFITAAGDKIPQSRVMPSALSTDRLIRAARFLSVLSNSAAKARIWIRRSSRTSQSSNTAPSR